MNKGSALETTHVRQNACEVEVVDRGHAYRLPSFDGELFQTLTFMKREGVGYPGNVGAYPGTNLQSVLRACIDRVLWLDSQIPCDNNTAILSHLRHCLLELEQRAAERHGRNPRAITLNQASNGAMCKTCGHVVCGHENAPSAPSGGSEHASRVSEEKGLIVLNGQQESEVLSWAKDDRLWTTQETVEFNLRVFARKILAVSGAREEVTDKNVS